MVIDCNMRRYRHWIREGLGGASYCCRTIDNIYSGTFED